LIKVLIRLSDRLTLLINFAIYGIDGLFYVGPGCTSCSEDSATDYERGKKSMFHKGLLGWSSAAIPGPESGFWAILTA
jgi:hypothetical protein